MRIDGKSYAQSVLSQLKKEVLLLKEQKNITPHLAVILVGDDPASVAYVNQKKIKGEAIGIHVSIHHYQESVITEELLKTVEQMNKDNNIHGIIIQQPLPSHIDAKKLIESTNPDKDVDGFHSASSFTPPIAEAVTKILEHIHELSVISKEERLRDPITNVAGGEISRYARNDKIYDWLKTQNVVVIGKGETGGAPIAHKLKTLGIEPVVIDSKTQNPNKLTKQADIIVSCVGKANILTKENIKPGVILLSIGMFRGDDGKLHGDYEEDEIKDIVSYYTPVPGGIGPINVAMLLTNVLKSAH